MSSLAEPEKSGYCRSCGNRAIGGPTLEILGDYEPVCAACISRIRATGEWDYWLPTKEDSPLHLPEGFGELFNAARVLLEENAEENQIIPTLALANHFCHGVPRLAAEKERLVRLWEDGQAWDAVADGFARRFGGLRPARVVHGVLILERRPALIVVGYALISKTPVDVVVTVYPHRTPLATPAEVALEYDKVLSDARIAHDEPCSVRLSSNLYNRRLEISISPGTVVERTTVTEGVTVPRPGWRTDKRTSFPQPHLVGKLYEALVATAAADGLAADLPTRKSSGPPKPENLIPACVAFLLEGYGVDHQEIYRLLDERVLDETWKSHLDLPWWERDSFRRAATGTLKNQVSRLARHDTNVRDPLMDAAWTLFWEGYE